MKPIAVFVVVAVAGPEPKKVSDADKTPAKPSKAELKKTIKEHVAEALDEVKIHDVLFSDFVVQF